MGFCCIYDPLEVLCSLRISGAACHAMKTSDAIGQCMHHFVGMGDGGVDDALVFELNCVG